MRSRKKVLTFFLLDYCPEMSTPSTDPLKAALQSIPEYSTAKVQFYYSSLPGRKTSNPTGYSSALSWWRKTLSELTAKGLLSSDKLILEVDEDLKEKLRWDKIGRPSSLGVIVVSLSTFFQVILLMLKPSIARTGRIGDKLRPRFARNLSFFSRSPRFLSPLSAFPTFLVGNLESDRIFGTWRAS